MKRLNQAHIPVTDTYKYLVVRKGDRQSQSYMFYPKNISKIITYGGKKKNKTRNPLIILETEGKKKIKSLILNLGDQSQPRCAFVI